MEIERKYLLRALPPEAAHVRPKEIDQGYLPGSRLVERSELAVAFRRTT